MTTTTGRGRYHVIDAFIGEGTFGKVIKARDTVTGKVVAIKRVKILKPENKNADINIMDGINITVYKEINIMKELQHENLIGLDDVFVEGDFINLAMPLMASDLKQVLTKRTRLSEPHMKCILQQILRGIQELHRCWFLHRDLSPANVFIDEHGVCKVADYGLSRTYGAPRLAPQTDEVVTLWYRPPELLFGARYYQGKVDMWSVGCILGEMLLGGKPLFPGTSDVNQLQRIFSVLGTPAVSKDDDGEATNAGRWPSARFLPKFIEFSYKEMTPWRDIFPGASVGAVDLIENLLKLDPNERLTASEALDHFWFKNPPRPCLPSQLPVSI